MGERDAGSQAVGIIATAFRASRDTSSDSATDEFKFGPVVRTVCILPEDDLDSLLGSSSAETDAKQLLLQGKHSYAWLPPSQLATTGVGTRTATGTQ